MVLGIGKFVVVGCVLVLPSTIKLIKLSRIRPLYRGDSVVSGWVGRRQDLLGVGLLGLVCVGLYCYDLQFPPTPVAVRGPILRVAWANGRRVWRLGLKRGLWDMV